MKTLVTGAGGFIGSVLVRELIARGDRVRALVLPGENADALKKQGAEIVQGDLTVPENLCGICDSIDTVYHLAGRVTDWGTKRQFYSAHYDTTANLIKEAAGRASRFVYISSVAAMGMGRHQKGIKEFVRIENCGLSCREMQNNVGVDLHKTQMTVCYLTDDDQVSQKVYRTDQAGYEGFCSETGMYPPLMPSL